MENLYNAVLSYKGEGGFTFSLPKYGELTIYAGRDIFVKGLSIAGVEAIRQLRPLLLEHKLNGKPDGCYRVIDLTTLNHGIMPRIQPRYGEPVMPIKSVADLKAEMIKTDGPIIKDEFITDNVNDINDSKIDNIEENKLDTTKDKSNVIKVEDTNIQSEANKSASKRNSLKNKIISGTRKNAKKNKSK